MMRTRTIKPSICHNAELGQFGPVAEIVFTRLWMLADREGRLEYDPRKIKFEALANYDSITVEVLENAVDFLWKSDMVNLYSGHVGANEIVKSCLAIVNFKKHQWVHTSERPSVISAPPEPNGNKRSSRRKTSSTPPESAGDSRSSPEIPTDRPLVTSNYTSSQVLDKSSTFGDVARARRSRKTPTPTAAPPERAPDPEPDPETPPPESGRKPPATDIRRNGPDPTPKLPKAQAATVESQSFGVLRESLNGLAQLLRMPEPDDDLVRQVLDAGNGASGEEVHEVVRGLYLQRRFETMRSWGLLPRIVAPWFRARRTG